MSRTAAVEVHGRCSAEHAQVAETFESLVRDDPDAGGSVAVVVEGELVVELWGGVADELDGRAWSRDTVTCVWSTTKALAALTVLALCDDGILDLDAPVHRWWPAFEQQAKAHVRLHHVLSHTAGLPGWTEPMSIADLHDFELATDRLAAQRPWWEPGTAAGYHAVTQGFLLDRVVRGATGRTLGAWFRQLLAEPLGADAWIGLPRGEHGRAARLVAPTTPLGAGAVGPLADRALRNPIVDAAIGNTERFRSASLPACSGHATASGVAIVQNVLANRGCGGGRSLLAEELIDRAVAPAWVGEDLVLGAPGRYGLGLGISGPELRVSPAERACFWGGWGGSVVVNDLDHRTTLAYVPNRMSELIVHDLRGASLLLALAQAQLSL